jgi:DNA polymerase I-like protein with 3'-5' exonuclease and polymerase domains
MIANEDYDTVKAGVAAKVKKYVDLRQLAKAANFGFPGGLGIVKFIKWARKTYGVTLTESQVRDLKATWLGAFPEVRMLFNWVNEQMKRAGKRFTIEQHRSGRRRGGLTFCNGNNTLFQGLTADGAKEAMIRIFRACHTKGDPLHGARLAAFIYDEFLLEAPLNKCHESSVRMVELMKSGMEAYTPDCPATVECDAMFNWSKKAKAVYEDGRLVPFDRA